MPSFFPSRVRTLMVLCNVVSVLLLALSFWALPQGLRIDQPEAVRSLEYPGSELLEHLGGSSHVEVLQLQPFRLLVTSQKELSWLRPALEHLYDIEPQRGEAITLVVGKPSFHWSDHRNLSLWLAGLGLLLGLPGLIAGLARCRSYILARMRLPRFRRGGRSFGWPWYRPSRLARPGTPGLSLVQAVLSYYPEWVVKAILAEMPPQHAETLSSQTCGLTESARAHALAYFAGELSSDQGPSADDAQRWARLLVQQLKHRRRRIYTCPECDEVFVDEDSLSKHARSHKDFPEPQPVPQPRRTSRVSLLCLLAAGIGFFYAQIPQESTPASSPDRLLHHQIDPLLEQPVWLASCQRSGSARLLVDAPPELRPLVLERGGALGFGPETFYFVERPADRDFLWPWSLVLLGLATVGLTLLRTPRAARPAALGPGLPLPMAPAQGPQRAEGLVLELGEGLAHLSEARLANRLDSVRYHLELELGLRLSSLAVYQNHQLKAKSFVVKVRHISVAHASLQSEDFLAIGPEEKLRNLRGTRTVDPTYGMPGVWVSPEQRGVAERLGCMIFDPVSVITTLLAEVARSHADDLLTYQAAEQLLGQPELAGVVHQLHLRAVDKPALWQVMRQLLRERVSIRDLARICEGLLVVSDQRPTVTEMVEAARLALRDSLVSEYINNDGVLNCILVPPEVEDDILSGSAGSQVSLRLENWAANLRERGLQPVFVTRPECRRAVRELLGARSYHVVLSNQEVPPRVQIHSVLT
ncbi:FHIPEP family type III secretion protein [bacterium]|nr:FHIPEP family type III secretion protein [bacterium]